MNIVIRPHGNTQIALPLGYFVRRVSDVRVAIYDPQGRFVCHTTPDDAPVAILIDQRHETETKRPV